MLKQPIPLESNLIIRNAVKTDCDEIMRLINVNLILIEIFIYCIF
jgi:hypothetical protein